MVGSTPRGRRFQTGKPRPKNSGRKKGSLNKVSGETKHLLEEIFQQNADVIHRAILRGVKAAPPKSFAYLQLLAQYSLGKPAERVLLQGDPDKPLRVMFGGRYKRTNGKP